MLAGDVVFGTGEELERLLAGEGVWCSRRNVMKSVQVGVSITR